MSRALLLIYLTYGSCRFLPMRLIDFQEYESSGVDSSWIDSRRQICCSFAVSFPVLSNRIYSIKLLTSLSRSRMVSARLNWTLLHSLPEVAVLSDSGHFVFYDNLMWPRIFVFFSTNSSFCFIVITVSYLKRYNVFFLLSSFCAKENVMMS